MQKIVLSNKMNHGNFLDGFAAFSACHRSLIQAGLRCTKWVASLIFTTLLSLAQLITIALTLFSDFSVY
jgi:hypothetical protein